MTEEQIKKLYTGSKLQASTGEWTLDVPAVNTFAEKLSFRLHCVLSGGTPERTIRDVTVMVVQPETWPKERVIKALAERLSDGKVADGIQIDLKDET